MKNNILFLLIIILSACNNTIEKREINLIPQPVEIAIQPGIFKIDSKTDICIKDTVLQPVAEYLRNELQKNYGIDLPISQEMREKSYILLNIDSSISQKNAYSLIVNKCGIKITATDSRSAISAIQTFRQLLPIQKENKFFIPVPLVNIKDYPNWEWRGLMLDVARHFWSKEEVKRFLDMMALYKFNKFHWHLTDDQGWRIEIKQYPLLTEKGAWRTLNNHDKQCLKMAKSQSNPDFELPQEKLRHKDDTIVYGGFYTQEDIKEVVIYAAERGIDIIPEIDMPGHFSTAILYYPAISCFHKAGWGQTFSAPICPGKDYTLEFCQNVLKEVFELFPYEYVHIGADEVEKINWQKCPDCQNRMRKEKLSNEKELQSWFVKQMEAFFIAHGKKLIGWDEIIEGGLSKTATVMWWRSWVRDAVSKTTGQGNEIILAPNSHYYFDYTQNSNTLQKLYEFNPVPPGLTQEQQQFIKGIQANTWAEWIPSYKRLEYMIVPRMLVLSEVAWRGNSPDNWDNFYRRLISEFERLDEMKINYRPLDLAGIHTINAFVGETMVTWNYPLSNIDIRYTTNGSIPDKNSKQYTSPFLITESTDFTIRFFRPDGSAADIIKTSYKKEVYETGEDMKEKENGLQCKWHEAVINRCKEMDTIPVRQIYETNGIIIPDEVGGKRALHYSGYLNINKEDIYTFVLSSDDGSMLYIRNQIVVDNDGPHGPVTLSGQIALGPGLHSFNLYYFDMNNGGVIDLKMFDSDGNEIKLDGDIFYH